MGSRHTTGGDHMFTRIMHVPDERVISDEEIEEIRANRDLKRRVME